MIRVDPKAATMRSIPFDPRVTPVEVSVILTVSERPEPLVPLYREYSAPLRAEGRSFEFVVVSNPFFRDLTAPLVELAAAGEPIRFVETGRSFGETGLLRLALPECRGRVIMTLPAYRQVEAQALVRLLDEIDSGADFAAACRSPRNDAWINRAQSRVLHFALGGASRGRLHDVACGVRAMQRHVLDEIPLYGDLGRFLPLLALHHGHKVAEVPVRQHATNLASRVYSPGVYLRRLVDVVGLLFLLRFTDKPLRFFGLVGSMLSGAGALVLGVLFVQRLGGQGIADRPLLLISVLLFTIGLQAIALGLIGEMIVHFHAPRRRLYRVARTGRDATP